MSKTRIVKFSETRFPFDQASKAYRLRKKYRRWHRRNVFPFPIDHGYIAYADKYYAAMWSN